MNDETHSLNDAFSYRHIGKTNTHVHTHKHAHARMSAYVEEYERKSVAKFWRNNCVYVFICVSEPLCVSVCVRVAVSLPVLHVYVLLCCLRRKFIAFDFMRIC